MMPAPEIIPYSEIVALQKEVDIIYRYCDVSNLKKKHPDISISPDIEKQAAKIKGLIDAIPKQENLNKEKEALQNIIATARGWGKRVFKEDFNKNIDSEIQIDLKIQEDAKKSAPVPASAKTKRDPSPVSKPAISNKALLKHYKDSDILLKLINAQIDKIETPKKPPPNKAEKLAVLYASRDCALGIITVDQLEKVAEANKSKGKKGGYDTALFYSDTKLLLSKTVAFVNKSVKPINKKAETPVIENKNSIKLR